MPRTLPLGAAGTLGYGSVLVNTMPIWLVALSAKSDAGDAMPGILASVVLLAAAAGCGFGGRIPSGNLKLVSALLVVLIPGLGAIASAILPSVLLSAGALFGLAYGHLLHLSLRVLLAVDDPARAIGDALAGAIIVSLALLLIVTAYPGTIMLILSVLSFIPAAVAVVGRPADCTHDPGSTLRGTRWDELGFFVFFVAMGAYWTFLEVFAEQRSLGPISAWLFGGLVASAVGSGLAAQVKPNWRRRLMLLSMLAAAISGGATYATSTSWFVGTSILANGFFLFLFFPLYLGTAKTDQAGTRMAIYLAGFALGGGAGAMVLSLGSFPALAMAIAISGFVALPTALLPRPATGV